ncbi:MAG: amidohydrolase [Lentisphaeria bacterium]|nr:amidohydrolase [Lentisphaeria bacterium]
MRDLETVRKTALAAIENSKDSIIETGRWIWNNPESGYREVKTSAYIVNELRKLGLEVKTGLAMTGFRADIDTGKPGPTVAIMGEMDSLLIPNHPECDKNTGAVHSCGHNVGGPGLIGTAIAILAVKDDLCGKVVLIGTPAEEGIELDYRKKLMQEGKIQAISGKSQLMLEGVLDDVDIAYMNHLSKGFGHRDHNGAINKRLTFHGVSCHAAGPQNGRNALSAATLAMDAIGLMRESLGYNAYARIHGIITHGGDAVNIIPNEVTMEYMVRMPKLDEMLKLNERFDNVVMHAAKAAECEVTIETVNGFLPLYDDVELGHMVGDIVHYLQPDAAFDDNTTFAAGSTDMGDVATVIPAVHGYVPGCEGQAHGIDYRIGDEYSSYIVNAQVEALTAIELLYGDGARGKAIAAHKENLMPMEEYKATIRKINQTIKSTDL